MKIKNLRIKTQTILFTSLILSLLFMIQIYFYSILKTQTDNTISSIFYSIVEQTGIQIKELQKDIVEISSLAVANSMIQDSIYTYGAPEIIRNMSKIQKFLDDYRARNKNISVLCVIKNNKHFMSSQSVPLYPLVSKITKQLENIPASGMFTSSYLYDDHIYFAYITTIFSLDVSRRPEPQNGNYMIVIYELNTINFTSYHLIDSSRINVTITDENNSIIISPDINEYGMKFDPDKKQKNYLKQTVAMDNPNWNIIVSMPTENILKQNQALQYLIFFFIAIDILIVFFLFRLLNNTFMKRIMLLKNNIKKISDDDLNYQVHYVHNDELSEIVVVANQMLNKIRHLNEDKLSVMDKLYQAQLLQKETEIYYLWGQVSPHFLYNSMSFIQGAAFQYNATEVIQMTVSLSKVFRYFANNMAISTVRQDLDFAIEYFNIINMRRQYPIQLNNLAEDNVLDTPCLKMIYQPILENVQKHAFLPEDSGTVTITSKLEDNCAIIQISDNGKGVSETRIQALQDSLNNNDFLIACQPIEHVGILNVHMRLKMYYGAEYGVEIYSKEYESCTVLIKLPAQTDEKNDN